MFGLDNKIISDVEELASYNVFLHIFVYANKLFTDSELERFTTNYIIPFSCAFFNETPICYKYAGDYLFNPDEDDAELLKPYDQKEYRQMKGKSLNSKTHSPSEDDPNEGIDNDDTYDNTDYLGNPEPSNEEDQDEEYLE